MFRWRRPGSGEMIALATVIAVAVVMYSRGEEMFSPGPLHAESRQNATLGGVRAHAEIRDCAACHAAPWSTQAMAGRCLDCHTDVRRQIDTGSTMHGKLANGMQCRNCHTEHKGAHAALTSFATFDHDCTAFPLVGKHQQADCRSCHVSEGFKGTSAACVSCHAKSDVHKGRMGTDCASCHSPRAWKETTLTVTGLGNFDHNTTGFPLTGKHTSTDCRSCHKNNVFKGTPKTCVACHAEPAVPQVHKFRYGTGCASCHKTDTFAGAAFAHPAFSITHGSRRNTCATCHTDLEHLEKYTCYNCHEHNPAKIERIHARRKVANLDDCTKCHGRGRRRADLGNDDSQPGICAGQLCAVLPMRSIGNGTVSDLIGDRFAEPTALFRSVGSRTPADPCSDPVFDAGELQRMSSFVDGKFAIFSQFRPAGGAAPTRRLGLRD